MSTVVQEPIEKRSLRGDSVSLRKEEFTVLNDVKILTAARDAKRAVEKLCSSDCEGLFDCCNATCNCAVWGSI